ncbi:MAG: hypothetical protein WD512_01685, partial [Candidatus Paceibacterota bacterium]
MTDQSNPNSIDLLNPDNTADLDENQEVEEVGEGQGGVVGPVENGVVGSVESGGQIVPVDDKDSFDIMNPNPNNLKIVMTVALPALNSKKVIWLALESLRLQENINFGWELIVWEEWGESKEIVKSFIKRLPNCLRVRYKSLSNQISLIRKWIGIRDEASKSSEVYVLHAADCFSPSRRLWIHRQHFLRHPDCILSTQYKGLFYN